MSEVSAEDFFGATGLAASTKSTRREVSAADFFRGAPAPDALDQSAREMTGPTAMARAVNSSIGKLADFVAGIPADIVGVTQNLRGRAAQTFEEGDKGPVTSGSPELAARAQRVREAGMKYEQDLDLPDWFRSPATWAVNKLGVGTGVDSEDLISKSIEHVSGKVADATKGALGKEDIQLMLRIGMDTAGVVGMKAAAANILRRAKGKPAAQAEAPAGPSGAPQLENIADIKAFSEPPPARAALPRPAIEGESTRVPDEAPALEAPRPDVMKFKPSDDLNLTQKGAADPKLLAAIAAGGGLATWALANPDAAREAAVGGMLIGGVIKPKGGMWHPEAVERLAAPLHEKLMPADNILAALDDKPLVKSEWAEKAVKGYLNKHAGTATDPLRAVEIPFGEGTKRWEELTDKVIQNAPAKYFSDIKGAKLDEPVYTAETQIPNTMRSETRAQTDERVASGRAITSYLSHVGDYLREHVPADKLPQYDLVRAVKETQKWDTDLAKNMAKAKLAEKEVSPIHKEYPDGMYWQQLTKPGQFARESDAMGHSVRGYEPPLRRAANGEPIEPHPDAPEGATEFGHESYGLGGWDAIKRGDAKVYSLRDKDGKSHVTIEVGAPEPRLAQYDSQGRNVGQGARDPRITQIKGKQNRAPSADYLPYVQDFVKGGKWGEVGDLENTGLNDIGQSKINSKPYNDMAEELYPGQRYLTEEEHGKLQEEGIKRTLANRQRGSVDPKLLARMAAMAAGAAIGYNVGGDHPILGAILGGLGAGALTKLSSRAAAHAIASAFVKDSRIRINDLANKWEGNIAKASRAVWQQQMDVVELAPKAEDRVALTKAIQSGEPLPANLAQAAEKVKAFFSAMGKQGQELGVLKDLIDNYVTNLWDLTGKNKAKWEDILNKAGGPSMSPESKFALKRKISSIEKGKELGLEPRTEDIAEIMGIYGNSLSRSIANHQLLESLKAARGPAGERLVMPSTSAPHSYSSVDSPTMAGRRVHPDIAPSLKFIFDNRDPGVIMNGLSALNTAIKRSAVSFSLFHAKALTDALIGAASNPLRAAKIVTSSAFGTNQYLKMLRRGEAGDLVDKALESGLKISFEKGKLADEDIGGSFYSGLKLAQKGLDSLVPGAGLPVKALTKLNHLVDTFMWERLHAGMKLSLFAEKYELLQRNGVAPKKAAEAASSFANDTFGGLNWRRIAEDARTKWGRDIALAAYGAQGRRWLQLMLFAPDWTLSTARAALKAFGPLAGYEAGSGPKGILNPKTATDLHRQYLIRSALYYALIGDGINYALTGHHIWDNRDPTTIELADGRTMQWSKHTMEAVHWATKGGQQFLNKLGFLPKEAANQVLGTEYLSTSGKTPPMDTSVGGRAKHVLKSMTPIAGQQAFGDSATLGTAISGALGAPIYGKTNEERAAAREAGKERARETRRNRVRNPDYDADVPGSKRYLRGSDAAPEESRGVKSMRAMAAREEFRQQQREEVAKEAYKRFGHKGLRDFLAEEEQAEIRKATPRQRAREVM